MKKIVLYLCLLLLSALSAQSQIAFNFGAQGIDGGKDIAIDSEGEIVVVGHFQGTVDFDKGPGSLIKTAQNSPLFPDAGDIFIAKYDSAGKVLWAFTFGSPDDDLANSVYIDFFDDIFVTGYFTGSVDFDPGPGARILDAGLGRNAFAAKYDYAGNLVFAVGLGDPETAPFDKDDKRYEEGYDIFSDWGGNIYVTGSFNGVIDLEPKDGQDMFDTFTSNSVSKDVFLAQYDPTGNFIWGFGIGGTGDDRGTSVRVDILGSVFLAGVFTNQMDFDPSDEVFTMPSSGAFDAFIMKLDYFGALEFAYAYGSSGNDFVNPGSLETDDFDNVFLAGYFEGTVDFNPGTPIDNRTSNGKADAFLTAISPSGQFKWAAAFGGPEADAINRIEFDNFRNVYTTGYFRISADFDPGAGTDLRTANSAPEVGDVFISKFDSTGKYLWVNAFGGQEQNTRNTQLGSGIALDKYDNLIITGRFALTAELEKTAPKTSITSSGAVDAFIVKYHTDGKLWNDAEPQPDSIKLLSPLGGENWLAGSVHDISWSTNIQSPIRVEFTSNGGTSWNTLAPSIASATYSWTLPSDTGSNFKVRVSKVADPAVASVSGAFRIYKESPPQKRITLLFPTGGEVLPVQGEAFIVRWESENVNTVNIKWREVDSDIWNLQASGIAASDGEYEWPMLTFFDNGSKTIVIKIEDEEDETVADTSGAFELDAWGGVEELSSVGISLYPNPGADILTVSFVLPEAGEVRIEAYDQSGRLAFTEAAEYSEGEAFARVHMSGEPSGTYILRISSGGRSSTRKFSIAR